MLPECSANTKTPVIQVPPRAEEAIYVGRNFKEKSGGHHWGLALVGLATARRFVAAGASSSSRGRRGPHLVRLPPDRPQLTAVEVDVSNLNGCRPASILYSMRNRAAAFGRLLEWGPMG